jgi:sarcosine oxidase
VPSALLIFGEQVNEYVTATRSAGAAVELLSGDELAERFEDLAFDGPGAFKGPALYEKTAKVLFADEILAALAGSMSGELRERERVTGLRETSEGVKVETDAAAYECRVAVLCGGVWSSELARHAGLAASACLEATLGQVAYLRRRSGPVDEVPAFIELARRAEWHGEIPSYAWGVPTPSLNSYKVGLHIQRETIEPSSVSLDPDNEELATLTARAAQLLPGFDSEPVSTERCFFDSSPDEEFVVDRIGRVVIGAGTSGRGFKYGPVLGEVMADLTEAKEPSVDVGRFSSMRRALRAP